MTNIIEANEIADVLATGDTVVIDARGGADALDRFNAGHLEGALFVDLETDLSEKSVNAAEGGRHPLPEVSKFGALLGRLGIGPSTRIIVYDDKRGAMAAARFWWMMKAVGHREVAVVSGGLEAIVQVGLPITTDFLELLTELEDYPVTEWQLPIAEMEQVANAAGNQGWIVIDVRENYRYQGISEPIDLVAGHIPGAVNIPYLDNLDGEGRFLPAKELRDKYAGILGETDPQNIIVHCGSGVTACHTLLALEEAGMSGAGLYVGSWSEWSRNGLPVAVGEA
ncbi:Putative thiosulfate sulfurtransferase SseB [Dyadobacter sp. CECT 9275]|uniref:Thiosulfate sulfurtransferase SseB n=2 Tax=Dyadobacter helix TaxID=2822344 RepID=A0A916JHP5_9BACT|nr:Putative thiosulfate sulfurtransferase SseB [Dyadobacter sp. CECT 9275]